MGLFKISLVRRINMSWNVSLNHIFVPFDANYVINFVPKSGIPSVWPWLQLAEPKCTENDLNKSQICPIWGQSEPIWMTNMTSPVYWPSGYLTRGVRLTSKGRNLGLFKINLSKFCLAEPKRSEKWPSKMVSFVSFSANLPHVWAKSELPVVTSVTNRDLDILRHNQFSH